MALLPSSTLPSSTVGNGALRWSPCDPWQDSQISPLIRELSSPSWSPNGLVSRTFCCQVGSMPFTYLGLPLGTTRPSLLEFTPLLSRIERRLFGVSKFLSYHGRLTLVNSVFSALPTFYMCSIKIPPQIIKQIDVFRKHCLWSNGDINRKGTCLADWETTCKPKSQGGSGILDIRRQNEALLVKSLDKFYNHADVPWVSLTWSAFYSNS